MTIEPKDNFAAIAARRQTVADLQDARHLIARGWCKEAAHQRSFWLKRPQYCLTGAVGACISGDVIDWTVRMIAATDAMYAAVFRSRGENFEHKTAALQCWNDDSARRKSHVLGAFDRAIASLG